MREESLGAPGKPLILQKVHTGFVNPSIAWRRSLVNNWLFLNLKIKSFRSLCKKEMFHEFRACWIVSKFGTAVSVTAAKVLTIRSLVGSALSVCCFKSIERNFFAPFLTVPKKPSIF